MLSVTYPGYNWKFDTDNKSKSPHNKKSQSVLKTVLKKMIPQSGKPHKYTFGLMRSLDVLEEYRHPDIVTSKGRHLELDLFYPQLKIAFEYQVITFLRCTYLIH
jgi:hypothetical protein